MFTELGRGGHGIVFLAEDTLIRRRVALKVPLPESLLSPSLRERFFREAELAATLDHPAIVPLYEAGEWGPVTYLVSAYCAGPNLAEWLARQATPVPLRLAAAILWTLADAVAHAHARNVIHGDLKPGNVMLDSLPSSATQRVPSELIHWGYFPRLSDFGVARSLEQLALSPIERRFVGTRAYAAPEQVAAAAGAIGSWTDVYGLGAMLYELLVGFPPGYSSDEPTTPASSAVRDIVSPRALRPEIPRLLENICLTCLHAQPAERYASAATLADELSRYLARAPITRRNSFSSRGKRWRSPRAAAVLATAVTVVLTLVTLIYPAVHCGNDPGQAAAVARTTLRSQAGLASAQELIGELLLLERDPTRDTLASRQKVPGLNRHLVRLNEELLRDVGHDSLPPGMRARAMYHEVMLRQDTTNPSDLEHLLVHAELLLKTPPQSSLLADEHWRLVSRIRYRRAQFAGDHFSDPQHAVLLADDARLAQSRVANRRGDDALFMTDLCRNLARWERQLKHPGTAAQWAREAADWLRQVAPLTADSERCALATAQLASTRGDLLRDQANWRAAVRVYGEGLALVEHLADLRPGNLTYQETKTGMKLSLARARLRAGESQIALQLLQQVLGEYRALTTPTRWPKPGLMARLELTQKELQRLGRP